MKGQNRDRIAQSKFVKSFYDWEKWLGQKNHFGIINGAEELLELRHGANNKEIVSLYDVDHLWAD